MEQNRSQSIGTTGYTFPFLFNPGKVTIEHKMDRLKIDVVPSPGAEALRTSTIRRDLENLALLKDGANRLFFRVDGRITLEELVPVQLLEYSNFHFRKRQYRSYLFLNNLLYNFFF